MRERILFVDDDANVLEAYQRKLQQALPVYTALGPHLGLRTLREKGPFAVVVADMNMPLMNGVEFLKNVRELSPDTVRMMLTGNSDVKTAMDAVNDGAVFRFLTKPCPSKLMGDSLVAAIEQHRLITAEKELLEGTLKGTAELLTEILSWVNPEAFGRTLQLRNTALGLAAKLNVKNEWEIGLAATLSQLGVMAIPQEILAKVSEGIELTNEEKLTLDSVPAVGHDLIERIPRLGDVAKIILYQQKRFCGEGFPDDATKENDIPVGARIMKVASDFHALRATGKSRQECLSEMKERDGWYDPSIIGILGRDAATTPAYAVPTQTLSVSMKDLRAGTDPCRSDIHVRGPNANSGRHACLGSAPDSPREICGNKRDKGAARGHCFTSSEPAAPMRPRAFPQH